ncbi:MAG: relaxase/mobilization nuclease domain-containing protein [Promicromonosporaceae bacterium]|nr:relaxase/mobilization nuclease domain-containing protein [Promicromonosporaceae bacterium]
MIVKIGHGNNPRGLAIYLHGKGNHNEHVYQGRVGGAVIGGTAGTIGDRTGKSWAREFDQAAKLRPDTKGRVYHMSIRNHDQDRVLTDREWSQIGARFAEKMSFQNHPYAVVRHADSHVHIAVSRVDFTGHVWNHSQDFRKARALSRALEKELGLTSTREHSQVRAITRGEYRHAENSGLTPAQHRSQLAQVVRQARDDAQGQGREAFERNLAAAGIECRANVAKTGRVSGYAFRAAGDDTAPWLKASQLHKELAWGQTQMILDGPERSHTPTPRERDNQNAPERHPNHAQPGLLVGAGRVIATSRDGHTLEDLAGHAGRKMGQRLATAIFRAAPTWGSPEQQTEMERD